MPAGSGAQLARREMVSLAGVTLSERDREALTFIGRNRYGGRTVAEVEKSYPDVDMAALVDAGYVERDVPPLKETVESLRVDSGPAPPQYILTVKGFLAAAGV